MKFITFNINRFNIQYIVIYYYINKKFNFKYFFDKTLNNE